MDDDGDDSMRWWAEVGQREEEEQPTPALPAQPQGEHDGNTDSEG